MSPTVLWITGAYGLIGGYLIRQAARLFPDARIIPVGRPELDLTDFTAVEQRLAQDRPNAVLHCAALSRSPVCQAEPDLARRVNVEVTRHLAEHCPEAALVFFSTDLVFDGTRGNYREDDAPNPLMIYGETKAEAERVVRNHPRHLIIRTTLNYGFSTTHDRSFNEEMVRAWRANRTLRLFTDEFRSPIAASETATAVLELLRAGTTGTVHVAGAERLSRWEIGDLLARKNPGVPAKLEPASLREFAGPPRPADVSLNCARAESLLGRPFPRFSTWLAEDREEPSSTGTPRAG